MAYQIIPLQRPSRGPSPLDVPSQDAQRPPRLCLLCGNPDCKLNSHRSFLAGGRNQGFRKHDVSALLSTSFATSYAFNPISIAVDRICEQSQLDIELREFVAHHNLPASLHKLIAYDIGHNTPFSDPAGNALGEVSAGWLVAAAIDDVACASVLNLWLIIEFTNTKRPDIERFSSRVPTLFLKLLRKSVEDERSMSMGTIFAASNHVATCFIFFDQTDSQRKVMMDGLEALVKARGGFGSLTETSHPGLLQSLLWSDVMYSCLTGVRPRFRVAAPLTMLHSLIPERNTMSKIPSLYHEFCGPDLMDTAKFLRFFLLFSHQSEVRALTKVEYQYMVALERYIHVQLLNQSAGYHETGTMAECIILAMGLMRMSVLCVREQYVIVRRTYTQRLGHALRKVSDKTWFEVDAAKALVWVCWVMLAQEKINYSQNGTVRSMIAALKRSLGERPGEWPDRWEKGFAREFEPLLWHADYDKRILSVVKMIKVEMQM